MSVSHVVSRPWPGEELALPGGLRLHVRHAPASGDAPGALFVHGLGGSSLNWTELMVRLRGDVDAYAPDLPGYGESPPRDDGDHGVEGLGRALDTAADEVVRRCGEPVHVVGNSMGGLLAVRLAASRPELVRTLALLSPALPLWRLPRDARFLSLLAIPRLGELAMRRNGRRPVEQQARMALTTVFGDPDLAPPERVAAAVDERTRRLDQPYADEVFLGSLRSLVTLGLRSPGGVWAEASRVTAPTMVTYGGRDRLVDRAAASRWRDVLPGARLAYLPRAGHVPQMEWPALVARLLREHWAA